MESVNSILKVLGIIRQGLLQIDLPTAKQMPANTPSRRMFNSSQ